MNDRVARHNGRRVRSLRKQHGVALLLFLLVLLVASSGYLIRHADSRVSAEQKRLAKSTQALADAKAALIAYAVQDTSRPGSLPCPDVDYDGQSLPITDYTGTCIQALGWFPYRSLDLQELRDDSGSRLWYAVADDYSSISTVPLNSETLGTLTLNATATPDVVAVIIAPGVAFDSQSRPGSGDTPDAGAHRGEFLENVNANATLEDYVSTAGGDFNDRVMIITRAELMRGVEKRVVGEVMGALQVFRTANGGAFPWPVPYSDPLVKANFRGDPGSPGAGTTEGLLPRHFGDDMDLGGGFADSGFPSTFTVAWSSLNNATVSQSGTMAISEVTNSPSAGAIGVGVAKADGECIWDQASKTAAARCQGTTPTIDLTAPEFGTAYQNYDPSGPGGPYPVVSWTRTYFFTLNLVGGSATGTSPPTLSSPRTRSVTFITLEAGSSWSVVESITYDPGGGPVTDSGAGSLFTTSTTTGSITVSDIYYYLDEETELPSWFADNDWHHLIYFTAAGDYLGGGDGDCLDATPSCLALEAYAATTVASDIGVAVLSAGSPIGGLGQDRKTGTADLAQYLEDADAAGNIVGSTISFRPRGDNGNNDHVQTMRAGVL